jgi:hypothetical protein
MATDYQAWYDTAKPSYTKVNEKRFADLAAGTSVLIPSPQDIEAVVDDLSPGETISLTELRQALATRHGADGSCPVMTGMHLRVAAEVNLAALAGTEANGSARPVVPIWRAIDPASPLAGKLDCGRDGIRSLRATDSVIEPQVVESPDVESQADNPGCHTP